MVQLNRQYGRAETASETRKIRVIGVGGAGSNILDRALLDGIDHVELTAVNTDVQSLTGSVFLSVPVWAAELDPVLPHLSRSSPKKLAPWCWCL